MRKKKKGAMGDSYSSEHPGFNDVGLNGQLFHMKETPKLEL